MCAASAVPSLGCVLCSGSFSCSAASHFLGIRRTNGAIAATHDRASMPPTECYHCGTTQEPHTGTVLDSHHKHDFW